jgi:hypothetical protein
MKKRKIRARKREGQWGILGFYFMWRCGERERMKRGRLSLVLLGLIVVGQNTSELRAVRIKRHTSPLLIGNMIAKTLKDDIFCRMFFCSDTNSFLQI